MPAPVRERCCRLVVGMQVSQVRGQALSLLESASRPGGLRRMFWRTFAGVVTYDRIDSFPRINGCARELAGPLAVGMRRPRGPVLPPPPAGRHHRGVPRLVCMDGVNSMTGTPPRLPEFLALARANEP